MRRSNFTLVELIVVIAIIAVVGAGISVLYTATIAKTARDQMTLYEMHQIKKAFSRFHTENYLALHKPLNNHLGGIIPDKMVYFAKYGLWFLLQNSIDISGHPDRMKFENYEPIKGMGWSGPYIDHGSSAMKYDDGEMKWLPKTALVIDTVNFPQVFDLSEKFYQVLFLDYIYNSRQYRRLLLVCSRTKSLIATGGDEILNNDDLDFDDNGTFNDSDFLRLIDVNTGSVNIECDGRYWVELLNEDR